MKATLFFCALKGLFVDFDSEFRVFVAHSPHIVYNELRFIEFTGLLVLVEVHTQRLERIESIDSLTYLYYIVNWS